MLCESTPMNRSRAALIKSLSDARIRLARQMDLLVSRRSDYGISRKDEIDELIRKVHDTLGEIEKSIAAVWHEKST
jgi:hypothetical protein